MNALQSGRVVAFRPDIAEKLGLSEAVVLQQLHYWMENKNAGIYTDGRKWIYNTYADWQEQLPFFSEPTIKRAMLKLEKLGILVSTMHSKRKGNRTKSYSIEYDHELLQITPPSLVPPVNGTTIMSPPSDQNDPMGHKVKMIRPSDQNDPLPEQVKMIRPSDQNDPLSTYTTTYNTTETTTEITGATEVADNFELTPTEKVKPKKAKTKNATITLEQLVAETGVDEQVAKDWLLVRKQRRAILTRTALNGVIGQAEKAGITTAEAIQISAERSWTGFNATWLANHQSSQQPRKSWKEIAQENNDLAIKQQLEKIQAQAKVEKDITPPKPKPSPINHNNEQCPF